MRMHSRKLHRFAISFIYSAGLYVSEASYADYGSSTITVTCNPSQDTFSVTPSIMWNEELDSFMQSHPDGEYRVGNSYTKVFEGVDRTFNFSCKTGHRTLGIQISKDWTGTKDILVVREDNQAIAEKVIDYVWFAAGEAYRVESSRPGTWGECCGAEDGAVGEPLRCGRLTTSKTSNCDEVKPLWK